MKEAANGLPSASPMDVFVCDQDFCVRPSHFLYIFRF